MFKKSVWILWSTTWPFESTRRSSTGKACPCTPRAATAASPSLQHQIPRKLTNHCKSHHILLQEQSGFLWGMFSRIYLYTIITFNTTFLSQRTKHTTQEQHPRAQETKPAWPNKQCIAKVTYIPDCTASHWDTVIMSIVLRVVIGPETSHSFFPTSNPRLTIVHGDRSDPFIHMYTQESYTE